MGTADFTHVPLTGPAKVGKLGLIFLAGLGRAVDFIRHIMARAQRMNRVRPPGQESPDQSRSLAGSPGWGMPFHPLAGLTAMSGQ